MYDQVETATMPMILQIMEGLKICGLLSTVQKYPKVWRSVFVNECIPLVTPTTLLDELEAVYSESQLQQAKGRRYILPVLCCDQFLGNERVKSSSSMGNWCVINSTTWLAKKNQGHFSWWLQYRMQV